MLTNEHSPEEVNKCKMFYGKVDICRRWFFVKLQFLDVCGTDQFHIEPMNTAFSYLSISIFFFTSYVWTYPKDQRGIQYKLNAFSDDTVKRHAMAT